MTGTRNTHLLALSVVYTADFSTLDAETLAAVHGELTVRERAFTDMIEALQRGTRVGPEDNVDGLFLLEICDPDCVEESISFLRAVIRKEAEEE